MSNATRTYCPYCGTTNLVKNQLRYVDEFCWPIFQCQMCKRMFTDLSMKEEITSKQELQTT